MKNTPLTDRHIALGAKMAEFAGYNMPISYTSITDEHHAVRKSVGVFDVSHMGEFIVRGKDALAFLQSATSNDVSKLQPGEVQYSCLPNKKGGIVDDLLVYRLDDTPEMTTAGEQSFMLVVNASNEAKDWRWLKRLARPFEVKMQNISAKTGLIAVQGPKAAEALRKLTDIDLGSIKYYNFRRGRFAGCNNVIISATGYTGSGGFEIYAKNKDLVKIWDKVFKAGEKYGIKPAGLGARDTLRLEMGYCLYGNDINDSTSPLEAGLGWITKLNKAADFPSKDRLLKQKADGLKRKLVGFVLDGERRVPRHDYVIKSKRGAIIGTVTSGTHSPTLDKPIGMGYVKTKHAEVGNKVYIVAGSKELEATIVKVPFVQPTT
ncbi:MAG TPA: glycine cleavage system aminomethyltransferase GcvT [Saprospiraceae bacterium]|nr:glycine cleavage system aminomethyltransferase GcvT [Saprospiraceae bacterium]HNG89663.1 glycine cleavage system aminomethyltransferase GcvT [Saprospiraceae bacterium]